MTHNIPEQWAQANSAIQKVQSKYIDFCKMDEISNALLEINRRSCIYYFQSNIAENKSFLLGLLPENGYEAVVLDDGVVAIRNDIIAFGCSLGRIMDKMFWPTTIEEATKLNLFVEAELAIKKDKLFPLTREDEIELLSDFF